MDSEKRSIHILYYIKSKCSVCQKTSMSPDMSLASPSGHQHIRHSSMWPKPGEAHDMIPQIMAFLMRADT